MRDPTRPSPKPAQEPAAPAAFNWLIREQVREALVIERAEKIARRARILWRMVGVGAFLSVFVVIASPNVLRFECRSKQSEAKTRLKALYVMQESHRAEHNRYGGVDDVGYRYRAQNYRVEVLMHDNDTFTARATGLPGTDTAGDVWEMGEDNTLANLENACQH
jgi:Tfp pilus assembly protein PilE